VKIFAVILNWNSANDTLECVDSLRAGDCVPECVVVDNASPDDSERVLRRRLDGVCAVVQTGENLGYAGGLRVGADYALERGADLLLFLNGDVVMQPYTLGKLAASVERNGPRCMVSPRVLYAADRKPYFTGRYLDPVTGEVGLKRPAGPLSHGADRSDLASDVIQGTCFLMPAGLIRELGFMSEDFFLYFEEFDYSFRLAAAGVRCFCVLSALALHKFEGARSAEGAAMARLRTYYRIRNRILLWRRRCQRAQARAFTRRLAWEQVRLFVGAGRSTDPVKWVRLQAVWHGLTGKAGRVYTPR